MAKGRRLDNGRYGKTFAHILTKEFLEDHYAKQRKSPYVIAKEVGCSVKLVYNYMHFHKIPQINLQGKLKPNMKFNMLTTIKEVGKTKNGTIRWLCKCECGQTTVVPTSALKNNKVKSCGCLQKLITGSKHHLWKGYCDVSGRRIADIRYRARVKNMTFDLDAKFLWELFVEQNSKCAISGLDIFLDKNASVDRIDSSKGYTKDNVWWTHTHVNKMKMDLDLDYFIEMCEIIAKHKKEGN